MIPSNTHLIEVLDNRLVAENTYKMVFNKCINALPGQFINIKLDGFYLRRPISISRLNSDSFEIIYKIKGSGTTALAAIEKGTIVDVLLPLGNGFTLVNNKKVLLVGGGVGVPPLLELMIQLQACNQVQLLIGLTNEAENAYQQYDPIVCTINESNAYHGNVVDYLKEAHLDYDYVYACGPMPMLKALQDYVDCPGQISIEERMGCGFGACMGCSTKTKEDESKRVCVEGPVFAIGELLL